MKVYIILLYFSLTLSTSATTFYTCLTDGENSTDASGTSPACAVSSSWNTTGNTLVIQNGHTFTYYDNTINGEIIVENGGEFNFVGIGSSNLTPDFNTSVSVESGGTINFINNTGGKNLKPTFKSNFLINGTLDMSGSSTKNIELIFGPNSAVEISGQFTFTMPGANALGRFTSKDGGTVLVKSTAIIALKDQWQTSNIEIESGAVVNVGRFKVSDGGSALINGEVTASNVSPFSTASGAGEFEAVSLTTLNGSITCDGFMTSQVNSSLGDIVGQGIITNTGAWTRNDTSTINGIDNWEVSFTSPADLSTTGFIWLGTNYTVSPASGYGSPGDKNSWIYIEEDYTSSIHGAVSQTKFVTISSSKTLTVDSDEDLTAVVTIINEGEIVIEDNVYFNPEVDLSGKGVITLKRNFSAQSKWYQMGFAITSGTVADLEASFAINDDTQPAEMQNIFLWDAATADWVAASSSTPLDGNSFNIFAFGSNPNISITRSNTDFNFSDASQNVNYNDGQSSPYLSGAVSATEGMNMHHNPFQAFIDWNEVTPVMTSSGFFSETAVYVRNDQGNYKYWNTGATPGARYIAPFQAFFVRTLATPASGYPGTFTYSPNMITVSPGLSVSSFKTTAINGNVLLAVDGIGGKVSTEVVLNNNATALFDGQFDAFWKNGEGAEFFSLDSNGNKYGLNQSDVFVNNAVPLVFTHTSNNTPFTISLDNAVLGGINYVVLEDLHAQTLTNLISNDYTFTNDTTAPEQRFKLHFSQSGIGMTELENGSALKVWVSGNELRFDENIDLEGAVINVYSVNGQLIATGTSENKISMNQAGVYVISVLTKDGRAYNVKVVNL